MMTMPKCMFCNHFIEDNQGMTCEAFPDGIPPEVAWDDEKNVCNNEIKFEE